MLDWLPVQYEICSRRRVVFRNASECYAGITERCVVMHRYKLGVMGDLAHVHVSEFMGK